MSDEDITLIYSPLTQTYTADGQTLQIEIYRLEGGSWALEVVDELGTSTVWDDPFETDTAALAAALEAIEKDGIHHFVTTAQEEAELAEPDLMRRLEEPARPQAPRAAADPMAPLSDEELNTLDDFLLDLDSDDGMTLDMLDGFLHALALGPETVMPSRWLPKVWGRGKGSLLPPVADLDEANHLLGLVMRHFNGIVEGLAQDPPAVHPTWPTTPYAEGEFEDAEMWARGFVEAVGLNKAAWQPLFDHPDGAQWYRPIHLLGAAQATADMEALTRTPAQRAALTAQIGGMLLNMHAFWLPLRQAVAERERARRLSPKVGRNEPCPCGSGKKFKKCCGAPAQLH